MNRRTAAFLSCALASAGILAGGGCGSTSNGPAPATREADRPAAAEPDPSAVQPVPLPDLAAGFGSDELQDRIRRQHAAVAAGGGGPATEPGARGAAYGELGMLLLAGGHAAEAETAFRNARALAPRDRRWPYYIGHVFRTLGEPRRAAAAFEQARRLEPNDLPTLTWLAEMQLEADDPTSARKMLEFALALEPDSAAVQYWLGRAAVAREDYFRAIQHFEEARALSPTAISINSALADAFRSIGETEAAEVNLQRLRLAERAGVALDAGIIVRPADTLLDDLEGLAGGAAVYERRGLRAFARADYRRAAAQLRRGVELEPGNVALRQKLGTALAVRGDAAGAQEQFEQVIQRAPDHAQAHFSLGVLLEERAEPLQALGRYTAAVRYDPGHAEARMRLARLLRMSERPDDALAQYERVMELDSDIFEAPFGYAMVLVSSGRWADARDRLADDMRRYPGPPAFPIALARILAAAPDERVRDGRRALEIMEQLPEEQQRVDLGETLAMALAENGRYREAADLQREAIAAAPPELAGRMAENLALYEAGQPSRTPWREGELP